MRVAVDTGGTFTDFVAIHEGRLLSHKVSSTPKDPSQAVMEGLRELGIKAPDVLLHGTTVGTNAFLTRRGAKVLLVTTAGFEDILFIGRQNRPRLFDFWVTKPAPILKRSQIVGLYERMSPQGEVLTPLCTKDLDLLRRLLAEGRFEAVAVSFLHSYANPLHERRVKEHLAELGIHVSISSEVLPEFREFERTSTTILNAYLFPVIARYVQQLRRKLKGTKIFLMQSSGGLMPIEALTRRAVATLLSGPAAGVYGAYSLGQMLGVSKLITLDMGGTSTDVSLCNGGPTYTSNYELEGYPICLKMIDIHTIGAGGGSLAYFDRAGALRVGPQSAGADPGPVCYARGGTQPTVTDANLVLGRILPHRFLGGRLSLAKEAAVKALGKLAAQHGFEIEELAQGIIQIVNTNMEQAIKKVSVDRGMDPKDFTLFCFGGAGGLHATALARNLRMSQILIPRLSGVLSALGLLMARPAFSFSRSVFFSGPQVSMEYLAPLLEELAEEALREVARYGYKRETLQAEAEVDLRYQGQSHELTVPFDMRFQERFHQMHKRLYGYSLPVSPLEAVAVRVHLFTEPPTIELPKIQGQVLKPAERTRVIVEETQEEDVDVYRWGSLPPEAELKGPVIIVGSYATVWVEPGWRVFTDIYGNLWLKEA